MQYQAARLVEDMEKAIQEAEREGAHNDEIEALMMEAFSITQQILDSRKEQKRSLEQEMEDMEKRRGRLKKHLAIRLSEEDRAQSAGYGMKKGSRP